MILSDLRELKSILDIDVGDTSEDKKLNFLLEQASSWIEELLGKQLMYRSRTEYYAGTGTQQLLLRARPAYPTGMLVYADYGGLWGSASGAFGSETALTYGEDYALDLDDDEGTKSRSGILIRATGYWPLPFARTRGVLSPFRGKSYGNVKVVYNAGYLVDDLPAQLRLACNTLVARLLAFFPLGMEVGSESYEERSVSLIAERKDYLLASVKSMCWSYRNWKW